jgi:hypothetical protein
MESAAAETVTGDNENSNNNVTANDTENGVKGGPNPSLSQEPEPVPESPSKDVPWASIQGVTDHNVCASVEEMEDSVYFLFPDWRQRQSRFWILLVSAAVIATAGVVGNSTATVIGASTFFVRSMRFFSISLPYPFPYTPYLSFFRIIVLRL